MKKIFLVVIVMQFALHSFAQDPHITLGNIPDNPVAINGKESAIKTTRSQMIANDKLVMNIPGYEIKHYSFSLKSGTDIIYGPVDVKGARLTPDIINAINKAKGTCVFAYIDEIKVIGPDRLMRSVRGLAFTFDQ